MSMILNLLRVDEEDLNDFLEDSSQLEDRFYAGEEDEEEDECLLDIDKAWDGIIYLLTGNSLETIPDLDDPSSLHVILFSGQLVDEEQEIGYGPAHYLVPEQVQMIADHLKTITKEELMENFNPEDMEAKGVYPEIWKDEEAFDYLYDYYVQLLDFYDRAASNNQAVITILN